MLDWLLKRAPPVLLDFNEIILDRLWVGSYVLPEHVKRLQLMGITSVINTQTDEDIERYGIETGKLNKAYSSAGIAQRRLPIPDFDEHALFDRVPECVEALESALDGRWSKVYLHCTAGINRSPTVAAAFLMKTRGFDADQARSYLVEHRDCDPYIDVLQRYALCLGPQDGR
jgi:protein-tyrosine phosphatase